jgi:putative DNA primase/helicase
MKPLVIDPGHEKSDRQEEITAMDIVEGLKCGNPACSCDHEGTSGWVTHCPAHADGNPSFSVTEAEDGKILVHCHAGCGQSEVIEALIDRGLWPSKASMSVTYSEQPPKGRLVESYSYLNEEGRLVFEACRYKEPKTFRLRRPDGKGGHEYNLKGVPRVPFHLPEVLKAELVFIVEGEKDANNLASTGLTATCNPMGAGNWRPDFNQFFEGKQVVILPDNDEPGHKHAELVARHLHSTAKSVKVLELPGLPEKGDVSDWLAAGGTADQLFNLVEEAPEWQPNAKKSWTKEKHRGKPRDPSKPHLRAVGPDEEPELVPVKSVLPDAPVADGLIVPEGWSLSSQGVGKLIKKDSGLDLSMIAPTPILITGRLRNIADDTEAVKLAWPRDGEWRQRTVDRVVVATTRAITELANAGAPITSRNANDLVQYFADFEAANLRALPRALVSQHMGWQGDGGRLGFLWGRTLLRPDLDLVEAIELDSLPPDQWQKDIIAFRGADVGDEQLADALRSAGSLEDWIRAMQPIADYPKVLVALYGALAPPLLDILDYPNFIMDWCGRTSAGKTTTVRVGGSAWGNPDERVAASIVATWDATPVWIKRASTLLHSLPLILDDTKRCKNSKLIAQILYDVASGRDRGRGSLKGTRRSGTWTTVLLSTGEAPATSFTTDGGTRARVLTLWGHPFGQADPTTAPVVQQVNRNIRQNYGHAGPLFVNFLLAHQEDWALWRNKYHEVQEAYQEKAGADPVAGRLCAYFAALDLTAGIAHAALDLPWAYRDPIEGLWHELISGAEEADVAIQALALVTGWAKANQMRFYGRQPEPRTPLNGWAGRWDSGKDWEYIAFLPHFLKPLLTDAGFEPEAVIRTWQDRGWLLVDKTRRQKQVRLDGEPTWTVAIRRSAIEERE